MSISLQTESRRIYLTGNTYPIKDAIKAIGGHFDGARKAWWVGVGKRAEAEKIASQAPQSGGQQRDNTPRDGQDSTVAGRAKYEGRTYYMAGRIDHGDTHWDDGVQAVTTRDDRKVLLYFRDGSKQFWADRTAIEVVKNYARPQTIAGLRAFAQRAKEADRCGTPLPRGGWCQCGNNDEPMSMGFAQYAGSIIECPDCGGKIDVG